MKPERIAEIVDKWAEYFFEKDYREDLPEVISKAIHEAIEEENRWYYPEKGELPDHAEQVIVCCKADTVMTGWIRFNEVADCISFFQQGEEHSFDLDFVKCWRYAPEVPGGEDD